MAIQNNYDGPPSLKIYQDFVRTTTGGGVDQNAVIVAQHFDVFKPENAAEDDFFAYSVDMPGTHELKWLKEDGTGDIKAMYNNVDTDSVRLHFKGASVEQCSMTGKLGDTDNVIIFENVDFSARGTTPETIVVGDMVVANDKVARIISIENGTSRASATIDNSTFKLSGNFTGSADCVYYLTVSAVKETEGVVTGATVRISTQDNSFNDTIELSGSTAKRLGSSGISVAVNSWTGIAVSTNPVATITCMTAKTVKNTIRVNQSITGSNVVVRFGKVRDFVVKYPNMTDETIILNGTTVDTVFGGREVNDAAVICGKVFVEFRAVNTTFNGRLGYIDATNMNEIGLPVVENPAGAMVSAALKGGLGVYVTTVYGNTLADYRKAFILLAKSTNTYGIVLGTTDKAIIAEGATFVEQMAGPDVANYKILYYGLDASDEGVIFDKINEYDNSGRVIASRDVLATISNGIITIDSNTDGFFTAGVMAGDKIRMAGNVYTIKSVLTNDTAELTDANANVSVSYVITVTRKLEGQALVDELKSRVYTANHRCYCVFGDGISVDGIDNAPAWLLAALPAGMRAGAYCQRPISNLAYDGCTADNKLVLSPAEMRDLASRGVWILANTADGSTVYNYHQLSTDMSDKKYQEQSYTTNFDNISRGARALLLPYYGNSNISEEFINQLYANLSAYLSAKRVNAPSVEVGPQLISFSNLTIEQDTVNKDRVYMKVDYVMPAPFNHVEFRQRLM